MFPLLPTVYLPFCPSLAWAGRGKSFKELYTGSLEIQSYCGFNWLPHGPQQGYRVHWPPCCALLFSAFLSISARILAACTELPLCPKHNNLFFGERRHGFFRMKNHPWNKYSAKSNMSINIGSIKREEGTRRGRERTMVFSHLLFAGHYAQMIYMWPFLYSSHQNHDIGAAPSIIGDNKARKGPETPLNCTTVGKESGGIDEL